MKKRYALSFLIAVLFLITETPALGQASNIYIGIEHRVLYHNFKTGNLLGVQLSKAYGKKEFGFAVFHSLNDYRFFSNQTPFGPQRDELTSLTYGGFTTNYNFVSNHRLIFSGSMLIGAGKFNRTTQDFDLITFSPEVFYLLEPGVEAGLNISERLRLTLGTRYLASFTSTNDNFADIDSFLTSAKFSFKI